MDQPTIKTLFVTDSPDAVGHIDPALASVPGIEIVGTATPTDDLITLATVHQPDVMVIDYDLPGFDAAEVTRAILHDDSSIQVIMLSVVNSVEDIRHAMRAGARDYLIKPLNPGELVETIEWLIRERREFARTQTFIQQMRRAYEALFTDDKPVPANIVEMLEQEAAHQPDDRLTQETLAVAYARNRDWRKLAPLVARLAEMHFDA